MPDMDGIEALKRIRTWEKSRNIQLGKGAKVIMLTADKASDSIASSFNAGCETYIFKPFDKRAFVKAISEFISIDD